MHYLFSLLGLLVILQFTSCKKDQLLTSSDAKLSFSQDSVLFDTVFVQTGSTTRYFRVSNPNSQRIKISSLKLARGNSSFYRLNVDGVPGKSFNDIEIPAHDSIYVFVEVTVDPNNISNPFIYQDSVVFETNGTVQDVDLVCFARNAYFHYPQHFIPFKNGSSFGYSLSSVVQKDSVWNNDKPHVIYGYVVIDSTFSLTINAGTEVYIHQNGGIWVYRYGAIKVMGTATSPVLFQQDRLDPEYKDIAGQWDRIWIHQGSNKNEINYAVIKNSFIGIQASYSGLDGFYASLSDPKKLKLYNTKIQNCSGIGILTRYFNVEAGNCVISNCKEQLVALQYGGSYSFRHCTIANYWTHASRSTPSVFINNYTEAETIPIDSAYFVNCIIDGTNADELQIDSAADANSFKHVLFDHCLVKTQLNTGASPYLFKNVLQNASASFVNPGLYDFKLNANSAAIDLGTNLPNYPLDIDGQSRIGLPDIGAYEYKP